MARHLLAALEMSNAYAFPVFRILSASLTLEALALECPLLGKVAQVNALPLPALISPPRRCLNQYSSRRDGFANPYVG